MNADGKEVVVSKAEKVEKARLARTQPEAPPIYGRLQLQGPIKTMNGGEGHEIVVYRPTCKTMTEVLDTPRVQVQLERFVDACCRLVNGTGETSTFSHKELLSSDSAELSSVITAMSDDAERVTVDESGDGITSPVVYTLQRPISLPATNELVSQFEFIARKVGEITEFLDARGETKEFHTFMRLFSKPLGIQSAMGTFTSDILINAIDFLDYLVIRRQIMGKFIASRNRWKRESSLVH